MHLNSLLLFDKYGSAYFSQGCRVLEIGPDASPSSYCKRVTGVDVWDTLEFETQEYGKTTFITSDLYQYPIPGSSYDIIFCGQVMEHVAEIWTWLIELKRILRPGGLIILITPTSWPYHEAPIDCWRIYPDGMRSLAAWVNLDVKQMVWECLEREMLKDMKHLKFIEGRSCFHDTGIEGLRKKNFYNGLIGRLPFFRHLQLTTEIATDLFTVLEKRK